MPDTSKVLPESCEGGSMKTPEEWAKKWCICEAYWADYNKTDPRCRHEDIEDIVGQAQAEAWNAAIAAAALICDRSEDECNEESICHAHDSAEIRALEKGTE